MKKIMATLTAFCLFLSFSIPGVYSQLTEGVANIGSCLRPNNTELERIITNSFLLADGLNQPTIRVLKVNFVCESPGLVKDTLGSFSAVVLYECSGLDAQNCSTTPVNLTDQFQTACDQGNTFSGPSSGLARTINPLATLDTPLNPNCSICAEPGGVVGTDPVNHCQGKFVASFCLVTVSLCPS